MNLQGLNKVEKPDFYIDIAFRQAEKRASELRQTIRLSKKIVKTDKSKTIELERVKTIVNVIKEQLMKLVKSFPSFDELDIFYQELMKTTMDVAQYKKSLGAIQWATKAVNDLAKNQMIKMKRSRDITAINKYRRAFYGRTNSVLQQIKKDLRYVEECRKIMKQYPAIKTSLKTVALAGYPNVGKTTLLKTITGANPKIASYPFTTQRLMLGYLKGKDKIQFIDTPGLLDRPLKKRNMIELQAVLALKHLTELLIFILDPSEMCGYSIDSQIKLMKDIKTSFKLPMVVVLNKVDVATKEQIAEVKKKVKNTILISAQEKTGTKELIEDIKTKISNAASSTKQKSRSLMRQ